MNIFFFEIKSYLRSAIGWMLSIIVILMLLMLGMFPMYMDAAEEVQKILENFPPAFAQAFGIAIESMFSFGGFYNFSFGYISLLGGVMAASFAITVFAREKKSKSMDFLLSKPVSRNQIFFMKLSACLALLADCNIIYILLFIGVYNAQGDGAISTGRVILAAAGLFFTQMIFLALGVLYAILAKRIRSISGTATIIGLAAFILSSMANVLDEKKMDYIAPLKYFEPERIFEGENYEVGFVIAAGIIFIVSIAVAYTKFVKSDAHQV